MRDHWTSLFPFQRGLFDGFARKEASQEDVKAQIPETSQGKPAQAQEVDENRLLSGAGFLLILEEVLDLLDQDLTPVFIVFRGIVL